MSARDRLAGLIWDKAARKWLHPGPREASDAILNAGYREPARVVTTEEELDTLPEGTVVMTHTPWLRARSARGHLVWGSVGDSEIYGADIVLADTVATVLYEPKERS